MMLIVRALVLNTVCPKLKRQQTEHGRTRIEIDVKYPLLLPTSIWRPPRLSRHVREGAIIPNYKFVIDPFYC